jgi:hypothetical protein
MTYIRTCHHENRQSLSARLVSVTGKQLQIIYYRIRRLFYDTGLSDATDAVLQPLGDHPGVLRRCELRLHHQARNSQLRALACETATQAEGSNPAWRRSFRPLDLPVEIRRHILEYTDLITPYNQFHWYASGGFRVLFRRPRCGGNKCDMDYHHGCRFVSCAQFSSRMTGCICTRNRSAYSSACQCWTSPRSILLANRLLYKEAIRVLHSCNRVVVVPSKGFRSCLDD